MATLANTFVQSNEVGTREDLIDKIYRVAREETPLTSNIGRRSVTDIQFDWQTDDLAAPDTANKRNEGNTFTPVVPNSTTRLANVCQISDKAFRISGTAEATRKAGRKSEVGYQYAKKMVELRRDVEAILLSHQVKALSDPRATGGLATYLKTNLSFGAGGAAPVGDGSNAPTVGTARAADEQFLKDVLSLAWSNGGKPDMVSLGAFNKMAFSAFPGIAEQRQQASGKAMKIIAAADMYLGDFGSVAFVPNYLQPAADALVLDTDALRIAYLRPYEKSNMGKSGDTAAEVLTVVEYGLQVDNEKACGAIYSLTTT